MSAPTVQHAIDAIERYFARFPASADSLRGIAQWWMPAMGLDVSIDVVERALEILSERGTIERATVAGGNAIYRARAKPTDRDVQDGAGDDAKQTGTPLARRPSCSPGTEDEVSA